MIKFGLDRYGKVEELDSQLLGKLRRNFLARTRRQLGMAAVFLPTVALRLRGIGSWSSGEMLAAALGFAVLMFAVSRYETYLQDVIFNRFGVAGLRLMVRGDITKKRYEQAGDPGHLWIGDDGARWVNPQGVELVLDSLPICLGVNSSEKIRAVRFGDGDWFPAIEA